MNKAVLPGLALVNVVVGLTIVATLLQGDPALETATPALQVPADLATGPPRAAAEARPDPDVGRSMFGNRPTSPAGHPVVQPAILQPGGDVMVLLGVLLTQESAGRATTTVLLRHGRPPIVSRLVPGGGVDGWTLVSATPTTATMARADGATQLLQVGK